MGACETRTKPSPPTRQTYEQNNKVQNFVSPAQEPQPVRHENSSRKNPSKISEKNSTSKIGSTVSKVTKSKRQGMKLIETIGQPETHIVFSALSYEKQEGTSVENYAPVQRVYGNILEGKDRDLDYKEEVVSANKSTLVASNEIMNYDLDEEGGVAWTTELPTFYYETNLMHDNFYRNRETDNHVRTLTHSKIHEINRNSRND